MNENLKDKELVIYAPYPSDDTDADVMDEMEIRSEDEDVDYDLIGEQEFVEEEAASSLQTEFEIYDDGEEYFEEESVVTVDTETDEYEFMPDINLDIYNAE